jgi:hypothetical protein
LCGSTKSVTRFWSNVLTLLALRFFKCSITLNAQLRLTPHVIYTDPAGEKEATAEFRRAHCKLWFNSKWRDLLYAAVTYLASADENILLPLGGDPSGSPDWPHLLLQATAVTSRKRCRVPSVGDIPFFQLYRSQNVR